MATQKILLVEPDAQALEVLVEAFVRRFNSNITCVSTGEDALDVEMFEPHSVAVVDTAVADVDPLTLVERLATFSDRPVIFIGHEPTPAEAIAALRHGVADYFVQPLDVPALLDSMARVMAARDTLRVQRQRYERMRTLVRRVIRDRRTLNRRVELICKDLVGAHKRLVHRVLEGQSLSAKQPDVINW